METDYQQVISLVAVFFKIALPIGLGLGLADKLSNLFFSLTFGREKINM